MRSSAIILSVLLQYPLRVYATTRFSSDSGICRIVGDADIYGIGIRLSFYLQWFALVIILLKVHERADAARTASNILATALYINTFRNTVRGGLVAFEWSLLWYLTFVLSWLNLPISKRDRSDIKGSLIVARILWTMYYITLPWVQFRGIDVGHVPGCDIKIFLLVPISIYNHKYRIAFKVISLVEAIFAVWYLWRVSRDTWSLIKAVNLPKPESVDSETGSGSPTRRKSADRLYGSILGVAQFISGALAIIFVELQLHFNNVDLSASSITDSGQLVPVIIGIFSAVTAVCSMFGLSYSQKIPQTVSLRLIATIR
jgi:hypothetical protein